MEEKAQKTTNEKGFDYSYVPTKARIAVYDDQLSAPHIIEINPNKTSQFIEELASTIHTCAKQQGGSIPYTAIREVSENFIHAQFTEVVVSILNDGKTIRFADQGPGIPNKEKAQLPGFSSAVEPMKEYIRGVGSGLPIVKEYLNFTNGQITIEDNLVTGAVVTLNQEPTKTNFADFEDKQTATTQQTGSESEKQHEAPLLNEREKTFLSYLLTKGSLGVTDLVTLTDSPQSSTHATLSKLEKKGLIKRDGNKKRTLTKFGTEIAKSL